MAWWNDASQVYVTISGDDPDWMNQLCCALVYIEGVKIREVNWRVAKELNARLENQKRSWLTRWMYETDTSPEALEKWKTTYDSMGQNFYSVETYEKYHKYEEIRAIEEMVNSCIQGRAEFKVPIKLHRIITQWAAAEAKDPYEDDPLEQLLKRWREIGETHGVREFTGNDHFLFANELRVAMTKARHPNVR
ncbi:hypothetical protein [Stenotrophomonas phage YB07]|uniref:Uncharacterized protein n=1 Tax=Stenotrophomonas phage YB07 TaxID=2555548 RepID=A0A482ID48_9CAUD|nr:hypothetical protein HWC11_gp183 [Stenotrophomonas phage YB07]QBP06379.1 hypothetical protein [Stenotrophomonas phage YB07]